MQVVTNENIQQLITTGKVEDFKPPEVKVDEKPDAPVTTEIKADPEVKAVDKPRDEQGKFVSDKAEGEKPKVESEEDDVKLTRKIEKIIGKKHREMKEAQEFGATEARRAIAAEQRAAALQAEIDQLKGKKSEGAKPDGESKGEPKPEDFKTVGEYTRALVKYEAQQAGEKSRQSVTENQQKEAANAQIAKFAERQEAFMTTTADYAEVLEGAPDVPQIASQYIIESDVGPQLAYHLAKNPDVIARLHKLTPARVVAELGKLETKFEQKEAPKPASPAPTEISKAPAPIQILEAKTTPVQKDPSQMSFQELRAFREAEKRAKRA